VLFGATLFGVVGALLSVPIAAAIQIAAREYMRFRGGRFDEPGDAPPGDEGGGPLGDTPPGDAPAPAPA
jgi:hypothetical protein